MTTEPTITDQLTYEPAELLASHPYAEPLVVGGVRCHGGFDDDGRYISPRTLHRVPAIGAWQRHHTELFGTDIIEAPIDLWPEHYPNVAQARFLLSEGIVQPMVATLTRIGTVEGFGAMIRHAPVPDLPSLFVEDIRGTALAHLTRGLYEAHARDEAGFEDEGGHKQMWFAARDIAFDHPVTEDETQRMLARMGFGPPPGATPPSPEELRAAAMADRLWPADVSFDLEQLVSRMVRILLIEVQAFHTFAWAEEVLADPDLVAGEGEAARIVSYIRADETPHVDYLRTVLTEIRDRTVIGDSGRRYPGRDLVQAVWDRAMTQSLGPNRANTIEVTNAEVRHALEGHPRARDLLAEFLHLGGDPGPVTGSAPRTAPTY